MEEATWLTLEELCEGIFDCPHSTPAVDPQGSCLLARTPDVLTGTFRAEAAQRVSYETFVERTRRATPAYGDLLYSREGTYFGVAAEVPVDGPPICLGQRMVLLRPDVSLVNPRYLRLYLNSPAIQIHLRGLHDGSVAQRLNLGTIRRLPVAVIPRSVQDSTASLLGALDDKIDLNREMNRTLEAIAQAIFRSWFVDFDPVVAKSEGREPFGMDAETAALFPDRFVESELGPIPEGWEVVPLSFLVDIIGGGTPRRSRPDFWGGPIPWFAIGDAPADGQVFVLDTTETITQAGLDGSAARLLEPLTTIVSARGTVGKLALAPLPMAMNQSCYALRSRAGASYFLFLATQRAVSELQRRAHGSVFDTIVRTTFGSISVASPPADVLGTFEELVRPFFDLILANLRESQTLAALRDLLLPKLLSGEIRVPEAEEMVEGVA